MSENSTTPQMNSIEELNQEVAKVSAETADLLGVEVSALTPEQLQKIQDRAQVRVRIRQARSEERAETERLKQELAASQAALKTSRQLGVRNPTSTAAPVSADRAKALINPVDFCRMSREQKLELLRENPAELPQLEADARKYFGRGNNTKDALELSKSRPAFYNRLREVAKILGVYAN